MNNKNISWAAKISHEQQRYFLAIVPCGGEASHKQHRRDVDEVEIVS